MSGIIKEATAFRQNDNGYIQLLRILTSHYIFYTEGSRMLLHFKVRNFPFWYAHLFKILVFFIYKMSTLK